MRVINRRVIDYNIVLIPVKKLMPRKSPGLNEVL